MVVVQERFEQVPQPQLPTQVPHSPQVDWLHSSQSGMSGPVVQICEQLDRQVQEKSQSCASAGEATNIQANPTTNATTTPSPFLLMATSKGKSVKPAVLA